MQNPKLPTNFEPIARAIEQVTGITFEQLCQRTRKWQVVDARVIFCYFAKQTGVRNSDIAFFIGFNHSDVKHYLDLYTDRIKFNKQFRQLANDIQLAISKLTDIQND